MRVLIMSDMEGVSGIVTWDWVNYGAPMYEEGRKRYTQEINAAVRARQMIEDGAKRALLDLPKKRTKPYVPAKPTTITVHLSTTDTASRFMGRPGVELVGPLKAVSVADDWMTAWNQIWHF